MCGDVCLQLCPFRAIAPIVPNTYCGKSYAGSLLFALARRVKRKKTPRNRLAGSRRCCSRIDVAVVKRVGTGCFHKAARREKGVEKRNRNDDM